MKNAEIIVNQFGQYNLESLQCLKIKRKELYLPMFDVSKIRYYQFETEICY